MKYVHHIGKLGCAAVALVFAGCASMKKPAYDTLISHRGESHDAPENTMYAFKTAVDRGFGFECDIYLSKDKRLFTFHDNSLSRTTDGKLKGSCTDVTWDEVLSKINVAGWGRWKRSKFPPCPPALLSEVLELARDGRYIYVEIKGDDVSWVPHIKRVVKSSKTANPGNVLFITFSRCLAAELKRAMPEYKTYWLSWKYASEKGKYVPWTAEKLIKELDALGVDGLDINYDSRYMTKEFIDEVKAAGYSFHVWTINDPKVAQEAFSRGADTVTTDRAKYILDNSKE